MRALFGLLILAITAIGVIGFVIRDRLPGGDGVLARLDGRTGESYFVIQQWNHWSEPYEVWFYLRTSDGRWGRSYIDHQSDRLHDVSIVANANWQNCSVYSGQTKLAEYDTVAQTFSLFGRSGQRGRTQRAPEQWQPPIPSFLQQWR